MEIILKFLNSYLLVVVVALVVGVLFSSSVIFLAPLSTLFLAIIFFLSSLKINLKQVWEEAHHWPTVLVVNIAMLFVIPAAIYLLTQSVYPTLAIAFLLLAVMPSGMTAPLLSEIVGGKQSLALVLTISTSLLAPITVPLVVKGLAGAEIAVSFWDMFWALAIVIYVPFILAQIVKRLKENYIQKVAHTFKPISILFLGLLIMAVVSRQAEVITESIFSGGEALVYLVALFIFFIILHLFGYMTIFWRDHVERITTTVCLTYMNFTLAIELANRFFPEPNILIPVVFSVIPWALLLSPFGKIARRL